MGVVKLSWNEFLGKANDKNTIKSVVGGNDFLRKSNNNKKWANLWEFSKYVGVDFLVNLILTKNVRKPMEVVKLCCNDQK